jgi:hypothetical protein
MKSALSLTLIFCLIGSALPVAAQERTATTGALTRAVTRAAARLTTVAQSQPGDAEWSRVRDLEPGTEMIVAVKGSGPGRRYFIAGDESYLNLLDVSDPAIPATVARVLVDTASEHPIYFVLAQHNRRFLLEEGVQLTFDGIFDGARKVAELEQIILQIDRADVAEVSVLEWHVGKATGWGAVIGAGAGLVAGLLTGNRVCGRPTCETFPPLAFGVIFSMFGGGIGSGLGAVVGATRGKTRDVIYRAF